MKAILILIVLFAPALADQRDGSNGVPFLTPDPSLVTTDAFYRGTGCQYIGPGPMSAYVLPPIFGGPVIEPQENKSWMDHSAHDAKFGDISITVGSASDLSDSQLSRWQAQDVKIIDGQIQYQPDGKTPIRVIGDNYLAGA
ncbi:hypothetical protein M0R72_21875 [Candidatus Pacearchaeota archaeon]|jgi:hypothetical protein|nr:hypothetical protein [Candidatus Pacearchaeota archaeon]